MEHFTPWSSLLGGVLIGLSAGILLWFNGRVAGITGIFGVLLERGVPGEGWRVAFIGGLVAGALLLLALLPDAIVAAPIRPLPVVALAGVVVGFGTRMGNGCTSGHGVCGIPRGSTRSISATATFIATGALTVALFDVLFGGAL